jgi:hypothetical protein
MTQAQIEAVLDETLEGRLPTGIVAWRQHSLKF